MWLVKLVTRVFGRRSGGVFNLKAPKRLHPHRTRLNLQVDLNTNQPTCRDFAEPSDGLEPSTPSLPFSSEAGRAGKGGKRRDESPAK